MSFTSALNGQDPKINDHTLPIEERLSALLAHRDANRGYVRFDTPTDEAHQASVDLFNAAHAAGVKFWLRMQGGSSVTYQVG